MCSTSHLYRHPAPFSGFSGRICVCSVGCGCDQCLWCYCISGLHAQSLFTTTTRGVAVCYSIVTSIFQIVTIAAQNDSSSFENNFWIYVRNFIMDAICGPCSKSSTSKWSRGVHTLVGLQECPCWHVKGLKEEQLSSLGQGWEIWCLWKMLGCSTPSQSHILDLNVWFQSLFLSSLSPSWAG